MMRGERCMIIMEKKDLKICRVVEEILLTHSQGIVVSSSTTVWPGFSLRFLVARERCNVTGEYLKEAHIWVKIALSYWTLAREFSVVNGEFSNLRCLMNTLFDIQDILWMLMQSRGMMGTDWILVLWTAILPRMELCKLKD